MQYFVGLDWAAHEHAVCVVDERGKVVTQFTVEHTAVGMTELVARLSKLAPPTELRLAIERPTGLKIIGNKIKSRAAPVSMSLRSARQCWEFKDVFHQGTTRLLPGSHNAVAEIRRREMIGNPHGYYAPPVHITKSHRTEHAYVLRRECSGTSSEKDRSPAVKTRRNSHPDRRRPGTEKSADRHH